MTDGTRRKLIIGGAVAGIGGLGAAAAILSGNGENGNGDSPTGGSPGNGDSGNESDSGYQDLEEEYPLVDAEPEWSYMKELRIPVGNNATADTTVNDADGGTRMIITDGSYRRQ